jgi:DNA-directed RNA polymerase
MAYEGGYIITRQPLILGHGHTTDLPNPVSALDLDAINTIQETAWEVNSGVLRVAEDIWNDPNRDWPGKGGKVHSRVIPAPMPRMPKDAWEALTTEGRKAALKARREANSKRASSESRLDSAADRLVIAQAVEGRPIWFPHVRDFRGRIYPAATSGPHPQGDDLAKALIRFHEGKVLGPDGLFWLCVRLANNFGKDKIPLEDRVQWALDHADMVAEVDAGASLWWTEADEPWQALATCLELAQALTYDDPETFVSHLPIPLDGSCNGLQHLSAMGLDPVGARATNLCGTDRQDIYEEVATRVRQAVSKDALNGCEKAAYWEEKVNRAVCKRACMTTAYGVTDGGIKRQLVDDGHAPSGAENRMFSDYLGDRLSDALGQTISAGKEIMAWLQVVARNLADAGLPFDWTTPTGSRCRQAYWKQARTEVRTIAGRVTLQQDVVGSTLPPRKQALGASPNVIHSFDAAHLALTVIAGRDEGIDSWAMIHDSFGTHAADTTRLSRVLREQFVEMYRRDWLAEIAAEIAQKHAHVRIPDPPKRGSFNIEEVLEAPFFFS